MFKLLLIINKIRLKVKTYLEPVLDKFTALCLRISTYVNSYFQSVRSSKNWL